MDFHHFALKVSNSIMLFGSAAKKRWSSTVSRQFCQKAMDFHHLQRKTMELRHPKRSSLDTRRPGSEYSGPGLSFNGCACRR
jgi:hypothetical protein